MTPFPNRRTFLFLLGSPLAAAIAGCGTTRPPLLGRVEDGSRTPRSAPIVTATPRAVTRPGEVVANTVPAAAGTAAGAGTVAAVNGEGPAVIYFGPDRYQVEETYLPLLQAHAERLRAEPQLQLRIDAFTDDVGPLDYNLELSRTRALMVQRQLRSMGVPARQIQIVAHGPGRAAGGSGTRAQASARRVELSFR